MQRKTVWTPVLCQDVQILGKTLKIEEKLYGMFYVQL